MRLTHFSLFSGIGGIDLAAEWAGFKTVGQCELADYPTKVLEKHWPDVPRWRDIKDVTAEEFKGRTGLRTVDLISGGFPCQPFSMAGNQKGKKDNRYLWPEMLRVIREIKPGWVLGENVAGLLSNDEGKSFETVIKGLENSEYEVLPVLSPACNYGASFEGKRIFIVATSKGSRYRGCSSEKLGTFLWELVTKEQGRNKVWGETERRVIQSVRTQKAIPKDLRVNYGFPDWVDRIKCLGNTVVPQQVYPILRAIVNISKE